MVERQVDSLSTAALGSAKALAKATAACVLMITHHADVEVHSVVTSLRDRAIVGYELLLVHAADLLASTAATEIRAGNFSVRG